jgi:hypothetical protein
MSGLKNLSCSHSTGERFQRVLSISTMIFFMVEFSHEEEKGVMIPRTRVNIIEFFPLGIGLVSLPGDKSIGPKPLLSLFQYNLSVLGFLN